MSETAKEPMYKVIDTSATAEAPVRVHDVMYSGKIEKVTFKANEATELPQSLAMKFNQDGFIVMDENGETYKPPVAKSEVVTKHLGEGEIVARLDELTVEALMARAALLPGGEKVKKSKKELIEFLTSAKPKSATASDAPRGNAGKEELSEISDDTMKKMFQE